MLDAASAVMEKVGGTVTVAGKAVVGPEHSPASRFLFELLQFGATGSLKRVALPPVKHWFVVQNTSIASQT